MADDPVVWLADHIAAGIRLREECRPVRTGEEARAWETHERRWADALRHGIKVRSPRDVARVEILDTVCVVPPLPTGHPWTAVTISGMDVSSTGTDCAGNNPFYCHAERIKRAKEIECEWRASVPRPPKLTAARNAVRETFDAWYEERARTAEKHDRSSREEDREAAERHFQCGIPHKWIRELRARLSPGHPYRALGRRRQNSEIPN